MYKSFPILLVEENTASRQILEKILRKEGYEVVSTENGRKALELYKEKFFPIILSDWIMPELDGFELCRSIRKKISGGYVFIILLTDKDSTDDIVSGFEAGADDYLTKPVNYAELIARIKTGMRILELEKSLKKANEEIRILSITDPLTGIYNRRFLSENIPKEIKRAERYNHPLSVILCDIDHFKKINDTYGHQTGDRVLQEFVLRIKKLTRDDLDWIARYGGEEFIIILPETDLEGARYMAERLRDDLSQVSIQIQEENIHITASFGVIGFDSMNGSRKTTPEAMIGQADRLLYQAKREGRNRVKVEMLYGFNSMAGKFYNEKQIIARSSGGGLY
ncbi:diguanylate cyclase [Deltaproteobacteria bacterium]|nr:diguanylate cyclase [Deltaproteobacteria bacterium]